MARERKFTTEELFAAAKPILLQHGYDGFSIQLLAETMEVSRGAVYKYYENKADLLTDYMIWEMDQFLLELRVIDQLPDFEAQFCFLIELIFNKPEVPELIKIATHIPGALSGKSGANNGKLDGLHLQMYACLEEFIAQGKKEGKLKPHLPSSLMLGFIFQTITIPNYQAIPRKEWVEAVMELLRYGMVLPDRTGN